MGILFQAYDLPLTVYHAGAGKDKHSLKEMLQSNELNAVVTGTLPYRDTVSKSCLCPYSTDGECRCHEEVMLVYGVGEPPVTLILECRGPWTSIYLSNSGAGQRSPLIRERIIHLLAPDCE
jgi:hypothetical protein